MGRTEGIAEGKARVAGAATEQQAAKEQAAKPQATPSGESEPPGQLDAAERLRTELARLRAKFGADPAIARSSLQSSLEEAWMSPTAGIEEDEAEFIDAVADCLGVGLSLDAALNCWDSGGLFYADDDNDENEAEETPPASVPTVVAHSHTYVTGRRLLIP